MWAEPITASIYIDAPPQRVYEFFTQPEAIVTWMGEHAVLDPTPAGRFELDIKGTPVRGQFLHLDPPHRLVVSWGYADSPHLPSGASTVEVRLIPDGPGTQVELEHRHLPASEHPGHISGWHHYLARLTLAATGSHPGPDPGMPT